jgi:hypothetical protein
MQQFERTEIEVPWLQSGEEILWSGRARFSRRLLSVGVLGLISLGCIVYFAITGVFLLALAFGVISEATLLVPGVLFLVSGGSRYHITDRRVLVLRGDRVRSVPLEELDRAILARIGFLDVASLSIYHDRRGGWTWPSGGTPLGGNNHTAYWLTLGLLRVSEAEEAEQVALQAKYAKDKGLI